MRPVVSKTRYFHSLEPFLVIFLNREDGGLPPKHIQIILLAIFGQIIQM
jgi:hypothetical protein